MPNRAEAHTIPIMISCLVRCLISLVVTATLALPAFPQTPPLKQPDPPTTQTVAKDAKPSSGGEGHPVPVPQYAVAIVITLLILTVVCMPSRKR